MIEELPWILLIGVSCAFVGAVYWLANKLRVYQRYIENLIAFVHHEIVDTVPPPMVDWNKALRNLIHMCPHCSLKNLENYFYLAMGANALADVKARKAMKTGDLSKLTDIERERMEELERLWNEFGLTGLRVFEVSGPAPKDAKMFVGYVIWCDICVKEKFDPMAWARNEITVERRGTAER